MSSSAHSLSVAFNPLSNTDGSVMFSQGNTAVVVAVQGPTEVKLQNLKVDRAHIECCFRPITGVTTIRDKLREALIIDACESAVLSTFHPRTAISIQVQELDNFGGVEACAINGACLALLITGIPMKFMVAAVYCILDKDDRLLLHPAQWQSVNCRASYMFVFDSIEKNIVAAHTRGCFTPEQLKQAEQLCRSSSEEMFLFFHKSLARFCSQKMPGSVKQQMPQEEIITMAVEA